jgi:hypothetical protein
VVQLCFGERLVMGAWGCELTMWAMRIAAVARKVEENIVVLICDRLSEGGMGMMWKMKRELLG